MLPGRLRSGAAARAGRRRRHRPARDRAHGPAPEHAPTSNRTTFRAIEFDRPDFPWLFTPANADTQARLRPWLCLVVVRKQDGVTLRSTADAPLPALEIAAPAKPADELPDLSESLGLGRMRRPPARPARTRAQLGATLGRRPELSLSRLLCPRLLAPITDYIACVVPTFELGRRRGSAWTSDADLTQPDRAEAGMVARRRRRPGDAARVSLWRFRTGEGGDFESLVLLLKPQPVPGGSGQAVARHQRPGFTLPPTFPPDATVRARGRAAADDQADARRYRWPDGSQIRFRPRSPIVNAPGIAQVARSAADPLLAPPMYGRWHAARATVTPGAARGSMS